VRDTSSGGTDLTLDSKLLLSLREVDGLKQREAVIFELLRDPLYRYFVCVLGDPSEAEDLTQEVFLRLFKHWRRGGKTQRPRAWIFRVAHNLVVDRRRKKSPFESLDEKEQKSVMERAADPGLNAEQHLLGREQEDLLQAALRHLTQQEQECLHLRAEGLSYREIASVLGMKLPTLVSWMGRIVNRVTRDLYD
jgi:RNA polymerase sigma-70 factor (ECF subfamily)